jgi:arylsulfatase
MDTHDPYLVPDAYRTQSRWAMYHANYRLWRQGHEPPFSETTHDRLVRAYDDSIAYADAFLDRLRTDLAGDDPLIAVHGDHGEAFGEHGSYGHHQRLYEENVHVPLVVDGTADHTVTAPVTLQRVPDVLDSLATDESVPEFDDWYVPAQTLDEDRVAVRARTCKYLRNGDGVRLYDLRTDASEESPCESVDDVCRTPVTNWEEHVAEQHRVADVVAGLEGRL